jgi:hypothetical protein
MNLHGLLWLCHIIWHLVVIAQDVPFSSLSLSLSKKLCDLSPLVNLTNLATATCQQSQCQLLLIEGI